ncbi:MAG: glycosyltransferase [Arenicella sp.]
MTKKPALRVLHICKVFLPVKGGVQKVVHSLTTLLNDYTHSVITTGEDGAIANEEVDHAQIFRCHSYGQIASMPLAPSLVSMAFRQTRQSDLIAVHYPFPLAELGLLFSPLNTPIVVHWHSAIIAQKKLKWLVAPLTWIILFRARAIVVTSQRMLTQSFFLRCFRRKIEFIPYGLKPAPENTNTTKVTNYFVIVGRHVSYKGIDIAIRAIEGTQLQLLVAGDGPLYEKHKKLANDLGVMGQIQFEPHATDDEIIGFLQQSIALVVSSVMENEAFALVQLEAMRLAKAVINTELQSSVPWVARHQQEALTVPPSDSKSLTNAMQLLVSDPELAQRLGNNGLNRFEAHFSSTVFATEIDKLYARLINASQQ